MFSKNPFFLKTSNSWCFSKKSILLKKHPKHWNPWPKAMAQAWPSAMDFSVFQSFYRYLAWFSVFWPHFTGIWPDFQSFGVIFQCFTVISSVFQWFPVFFRYFPWFSGISRVFWVISGIFGYFPVISGIFPLFRVFSGISRYFGSFRVIRVISGQFLAKTREPVGGWPVGTPVQYPAGYTPSVIY